MISYLRMHGVSINNPNAPRVQVTDEGLALGGPDWSALIDPAYVDGLKIVNRASGHVEDAVVTGGGADLPMGQFPNGEIAFAPENGNSIRFNPNSDINPEEFSMFAVAMPEPSPTRQQIVGTFLEPTAPLLAPVFGLTNGGNGLRFYPYGESSGDGRLVYNQTFSGTGVPWLLMITFSTRDGLRGFVNDSEVVTVPDDRRPLQARYQAGQWGIFQGIFGLYGMVGVLNSDLGQPENSERRLSMARFLIHKYGIPA